MNKDENNKMTFEIHHIEVLDSPGGLTPMVTAVTKSSVATSSMVVLLTSGGSGDDGSSVVSVGAAIGAVEGTVAASI